MRQKIVISGLALALLMLPLLACAKPAPAPTPAPAPAPTPSPTPAPAPAPAGKVIELRFTSHMPPTHTRITMAIEPWIKQVEERTGGRVKITLYPASSLAKLGQMYDATVSGIADLGELPTYAVAGRFLLTKMLAVSGMGERNNTQDSLLLWRMYKEIPAVQEEYKDIKVLWQLEIVADTIFSKKPIRTLADLKGLKIRGAPGPQYDAVNALGAVAVDVEYNNIYEALEKGVLDGAASTVEGVYDRRWYEIVKYGTTFDLGDVAFCGGMNWKVWNSLPADIQKIFEEMSGEYMIKFEAGVMDEQYSIKRKASQEKGVQFITLSPEEYARWQAAVKPVGDKYAAELDAKGLPGTKTLDYIKKALTK